MVMEQIQYYFTDRKGVRHNTYIKTTGTLAEIRALAGTDVSHLPLDVQDCVHTCEKYDR